MISGKYRNGMKAHPDNISPVEILQERRKKIDLYISRLRRNGDNGSEFLQFYEAKSVEFSNAIKKLSNDLK